MIKKEFFKKHKFLTVFIVLILLVLLGFLGFKLYLYIQYLIGNDLVISVSADRSDLSLVYGENGSVGFSIQRVTSPLCNTECMYSFLDVSENKSLDEANFSLSQVTQKKSEMISAVKPNRGQEIYRFSLVCRNAKTVICHTSGIPVSRDVLLTVEYGPNEDQNITRNVLAQEIYSAFNQTAVINSNLIYLQSILNEINGTLIIDNNLSNLSNFSNSILEEFKKINNSWSQGDYNGTEQTLFKVRVDSAGLLSDFKILNDSILSKLNQYNSLIDSLRSYGLNLSNLSNREMNQSDAVALDTLISGFNVKMDLFYHSQGLKDKMDIASSILENDLSSLNISNGSSRVVNVVNFNLTDVNVTLPDSFNSTFVLEDPLPECCVYNECKPCGKVDGEYPIIFVHGHDFSKDISAEYSLNAFQDIQTSLDADGFLNAGQLTLYDLQPNVSGLLGYVGVPITVRTTYYYDVLKESSSIYLPVQVKSENIDTYAIKLKTLIDKLKYETGQPRVVIVAHSMGGLVARRYVQLFGNESVDKLIMIGTPNGGISGTTATLCPIFGAIAECNDLTSGSLFLNKLNGDPTEYVKTYNIIGTGCGMNGEDGDGVVLSKNAVLNGSVEYHVNGNCSGVDLFHVEMLKPSKYPEVYNIVRDILNGN